MSIKELLDQLETLRGEVKEHLEKTYSEKELNEFKINFMGKKGKLAHIMKEMGKLSKEERPVFGENANKVREYIIASIDEKMKLYKAEALREKLEKETIDVTLPGRTHKKGGVHPLTLVVDEAVSIFTSLGFEVAEGPEIESDYYNFDALNIPKHHPARADHDTFWFNPELLLRTQTSGVQIRTMQKQQPPIRIMAPGRVYRNDYDQTHTPMFHQIELLYVDKHANFTELKGLLHDFLRAFFEEDLQVRFRPSYFPFTEPSAEVDVMGKNGKWLEVLGCGMVHPNVLRNVGIDPNEYSGFAVGMGVERLTMLRYNVTDLRSFFENDLRFLKQFK